MIGSAGGVQVAGRRLLDWEAVAGPPAIVQKTQLTGQSSPQSDRFGRIAVIPIKSSRGSASGAPVRSFFDHHEKRRPGVADRRSPKKLPPNRAAKPVAQGVFDRNWIRGNRVANPYSLPPIARCCYKSPVHGGAVAQWLELGTIIPPKTSKNAVKTGVSGVLANPLLTSLPIELVEACNGFDGETRAELLRFVNWLKQRQSPVTGDTA